VLYEETHLTFCIENSSCLGEEKEEKESDDEEEYAPSEYESEQSEVDPEEEDEEDIQMEPTVEEKVIDVIMSPKKRLIHWKTG